MIAPVTVWFGYLLDPNQTGNRLIDFTRRAVLVVQPDQTPGKTQPRDFSVFVEREYANNRFTRDAMSRDIASWIANEEFKADLRARSGVTHAS